MSTNDILKSLVDLEQNLKDIDSAKEQVTQVVASTEKLTDAIKSCEQSLGGISSNIENIIGENNTFYSEKLKHLSKEIEKFQDETSRLVDTDFNELFNELQKTFIEQTRKDVNVELQKIDGKAKELQTKINELQKELSRLINIDFNELFNELQKTFIEQTRKDLEVELKKIDNKTNDFQINIDDLKKQIERLEGIDLELHFGKLQKTLSEIFGAINSVNLILSDITQTFTNVTQSLGTIQNTIEVQNREIKQDIKNFSDIIKHHLDIQDEIAEKNKDLIEDLLMKQQQQLEALAEQNAYLRKEIKTNKTIQIIIGASLLLLFIYAFILAKL
ncbi:MAG: hypothetical protein LBR10_12090 [Prevotellaceae bacterium]|jgi:septation ring formation regulator EzrA|nr:hypothetical protein [Prevotellaceae bacterium]